MSGRHNMHVFVFYSSNQDVFKNVCDEKSNFKYLEKSRDYTRFIDKPKFYSIAIYLYLQLKEFPTEKKGLDNFNKHRKELILLIKIKH